MTLQFLNSKQKKQLLTQLEKQHSITQLPYTLLQAGRKRIRAFSGNLTKEQLFKLKEITNIETIGMYFINCKDTEPRINFDALPLLKNQIKNTLQINKEQLELWLRGHDLEIQTKRGTHILKFQDNLVGVGKSNTEKLFNYVPKERKLKIPL